MPHQFLTQHQKFTRYGIVLSTALILSSAMEIFSPTFSKPSAPAIAQTPARSFQPLPADACNLLWQAMAQTLGVTVTMKRGTFQDIGSEAQGTSCQLEATGNGRNFSELYVVVDNLSQMLTRQGWVAAPNYIADGPTGAARGYRKGNYLAVFYVQWEPSADANCPEEEPISDCQLSPEQQLYRIKLDGVRQ